MSQKNFKVVKTVSGFSKTTYVFGIGGASQKAARENAIQNMFEEANLTGAQTIVNIYLKKHVSSFLGLYRRVSYSASGVVIEFTDNEPTNSTITNK